MSWRVVPSFSNCEVSCVSWLQQRVAEMESSVETDDVPKRPFATNAGGETEGLEQSNPVGTKLSVIVAVRPCSGRKRVNASVGNLRTRLWQWPRSWRVLPTLSETTVSRRRALTFDVLPILAASRYSEPGLSHHSKVAFAWLGWWVILHKRPG